MTPYEVAATQKIQLERQLERQGETGADLRNLDHPTSSMPQNGHTTVSFINVTYGSGG